MADSESAQPSNSYLPPPLPPPFLSNPAITHLCQQGWLRISLPDHLHACVQQLHTHTSTFFAQPTTHKQTLFPAKQGTEFGYYHIPDEKEYLTLRCQQARSVPSESTLGPVSGAHSTVNTDIDANTSNSPHESLTAQASILWALTTTLLARILHDISAHLSLPPEIWADLLSGTTPMPDVETQIRSGTLLRLFRYQPRGGNAGTHTDLGLLTLCVGGRGLECFDFAKERWVDILDADVDGITTITSAAHEDGKGGGGEQEGAVVLIGQTLRGLTGGMLKAGVHRVLGTERGRESLVFALRHGWEKQEVDLGPWGGEGMVRARELYKWLGIGVVNVNAGVEVRERQRGRLEMMGLAEGGAD